MRTRLGVVADKTPGPSTRSPPLAMPSARILRSGGWNIKKQNRQSIPLLKIHNNTRNRVELLHRIARIKMLLNGSFCGTTQPFRALDLMTSCRFLRNFFAS
ncbi:MAG: hypothetical protein ACK6D3_11745 [Planctomycetaceae bacterium]